MPKAATSLLLCLLALVAIMLIGCQQDVVYEITVTVPSDENGPITQGHGFFVGGDIKGNRAIPEGASLRVSVLDGAGKELRFAESSTKGNQRVDSFCDAFFYYADDVDLKRSDVAAKEFSFLIVDGSEQSLKNANIKCWFSDDGFNAFIPYATDVGHGLLIDDG